MISRPPSHIDFSVPRPPTPQPSELPYLAEPGYYELDILEPYYRSARFPIPLGSLAPGSREALLATRMPQREPRMPGAIDQGYGRSWVPAYLGVGLLLAISAAVGVVVHRAAHTSPND